MSCGCKNRVNDYVDVSRQNSIPWADAPAVLGLSQCGDVVVLDKPIHELSDEDREKLDMLINTGEGDRYLADDGTYKEIDLSNIPNIVLLYENDPANFIVRNLDNLRKIWDDLNDGRDTFVRLDLQNDYVVPMVVGYSSTRLIFEFDNIIVPVTTARRVLGNRFRSTRLDIDPTASAYYTRLKVLIVLNMNLEVPTVSLYEVKQLTDIDEVVIVDGPGTNALYDDGTYKLTYNANQIDSLLDGYYDKNDTDSLLNLYSKKNGEDNQRLDLYTSSSATLKGDGGVSIEGGDSRLAIGTESLLFDERKVVVAETNGDIHSLGDIILDNDHKLLGTDPNGARYNLAEISRFTDNGHAIGDFSSASLHTNINSIDRPSVQLAGQSGAEAYHIAYKEELDTLQDQVNEIETDLESHVTEYEAFRTTVNDSFTTVNTELGDLSDRIEANVGNIALNRTDIDNLFTTVGTLGLFRGYKATTVDVTSIPNPLIDQYAYNVETGTVWSYNGTTWYDTLEPIPDGAIPASDVIPLADGVGSAGTSSEYARGDHRHPTDESRASVAELENYLPLAGNSQTNPVTGDIWLQTGRNVLLTDSGNSWLGQETNTQTSVLQGNGAGGIDLRTNLGTAKVNGVDIASVDMLADFLTESDVEGTYIKNGNNTGFGGAATTLRDDGGLYLSSSTGATYFNSIFMGGGTGTFTGYQWLINGSYSVDITSAPSSGQIYNGAVNIRAGNSNYGGRINLEYTNGTAGTGYVGGVFVNGDRIGLEKDIVSVTEAFQNVVDLYDLTDGNIILAQDKYIGFYGDGRTRIGYNESAQELRITATSTDNGIDVITNPSAPTTSKFKYNGIEVATVDYVQNALEDYVPDIPTDIYSKSEVDTLLDAKQGTLIAGDNINIVNNGDGTYTVSTDEFESVRVVTELPSTGVANVLYLLISSDPDNTYDKYIWVNGAWEFIGDTHTTIDLSDYLTISDFNDYKNEVAEDYQEKLESGVTLKTINGESLLGSGDLSINFQETTVINTLGDSSTKAISQRSATGLVYSDPATQNLISVGGSVTGTGIDDITIIGKRTLGRATDGVIIGNDASQGQNAMYGVAVGSNSQVGAVGGVAIGYLAGTSVQSGSLSTLEVAIGREAKSSNFGTAIGGGSEASTQGTAIGANAKASASGAVAIGYNTQNSVGNSVAFNNANARKRIIEVAPAIGNNDVVILSQLDEAINASETELKTYTDNAVEDAVTASAFDWGVYTLTGLTNIALQHYNNAYEITSGAALTVSFASAENGKEYTLSVLNSTATDVVITFSTEANHQATEETLTIPAGDVGEVFVKYIFNKFLIRV